LKGLQEPTTMSQLTIHNLDDAVWRGLNERAAAHGQTPEDVARAILVEALAKAEPDPWAEVNAIRERLAASGRTFSDSAELIAEDRLR
jgi:plasmid stability protein